MKIRDEVLLEFKIKLEELITDREAMIAGNKVREATGEQMAYPAEMFFTVNQEMKALREFLIELRKKNG